MEEFEQEFLSGFAWLLFHRFASLEVDDEGHVSFVGLPREIADQQARQFPGAAQLALLSVRDSLNEIRSREGGSGMNQLYKTLEKYVPACVLLLAVQRVMEEKGNATE